MKRYRLLGVSFDTRPLLLGEEVRDDWEPAIRDQWLENQRRLRTELQRDLGSADWSKKERDFIEMGPAPWSVVTSHSVLTHEIRKTFASGGYTAAAVATGTLGEQILNSLVRDLRDELAAASSPLLKKDWCTNWNILIEALSEWDVLPTHAGDAARHLRRIRNRAVHGGLGDDARNAALEAMGLLRTMIESAFGAHVPTRWFIQDHPSEAFISVDYESHAVVRRYYLPQCAHVGPLHELEWAGDGWLVRDQEYPNSAVTDEDFVRLRQQGVVAA